MPQPKRPADVGRIEAALRRLPIAAGSEMYATAIPQIARQLARLRSPPAASTSETRDELHEIETHARRLLQAIDSMHVPAIEALGGALGAALFDIRELTRQLRFLALAAQHAEIPPLPKKRGKTDAAIIADAAALHYHRLTGKQPGRQPDNYGEGKGPFVELLAEIYAAREIAVNDPEYQARQAKSRFPAKSAPKKGE